MLGKYLCIFNRIWWVHGECTVLTCILHLFFFFPLLFLLAGNKENLYHMASWLATSKYPTFHNLGMLARTSSHLEWYN